MCNFVCDSYQIRFFGIQWQKKSLAQRVFFGISVRYCIYPKKDKGCDRQIPVGVVFFFNGFTPCIGGRERGGGGGWGGKETHLPTAEWKGLRL